MVSHEIWGSNFLVLLLCDFLTGMVLKGKRRFASGARIGFWLWVQSPSWDTIPSGNRLVSRAKTLLWISIKIDLKQHISSLTLINSPIAFLVMWIAVVVGAISWGEMKFWGWWDIASFIFLLRRSLRDSSDVWVEDPSRVGYSLRNELIFP